MSSLTLTPLNVSIDDRGITVLGGQDSPLLVHFDDQYVWSFDAARDGSLTPRGLLVSWPTALRPYLNGTARFRLVSNPSGDVVLDQEVTLGDAGSRISVTDSQGHPLAVDKVGHLGRVFSETDHGIRAEVIEGTARLLRDLRERCGVEAYLNYGCLLGAIRDGKMISHDFDSDVCYLSAHTSPADVIAESFRVQRTLRSLDWNTTRMSGGDVKVLLPLSDGRICHIDVFVAFFVEGVFYQLGNRSGQLPREAIVPVSTVTLEGVELPAPADPEAMLAFLYGPSWQVPDPSFKYADPPDGIRRLDGWLRGFRSDAPLWSGFYESPEGRSIPRQASSFARWTAALVDREDAILDLGTGCGRDAVHFQELGHPVRTFDFSVVARRRTNKRLRKTNPEARAAEVFMLGDLRRVLALAAERAAAEDTAHLYARRLLGCLNPTERANLWLLARTALRRDGSLFLEFGASQADCEDLPTAPLERRLDPDEIAAEIRASGGHLLSFEVGPGTDPFDQVDPLVCRIRAVWPVSRSSAPTNPADTKESAMTLTHRARTKVSSLRRRGINTRLAALETEVQENRQLNRRIAELTDVVAELLVPIQDRDEEQVRSAIAAYRNGL